MVQTILLKPFCSYYYQATAAAGPARGQPRCSDFRVSWSPTDGSEPWRRRRAEWYGCQRLRRRGRCWCRSKLPWSSGARQRLGSVLLEASTTVGLLHWTHASERACTRAQMRHAAWLDERDCRAHGYATVQPMCSADSVGLRERCTPGNKCVDCINRGHHTLAKVHAVAATAMYVL